MKKLRIGFALLFFLALAGCAVWMFATPDRAFSENENRYLTGRPELTAQSVLDGKFQDKLSDFLSDQFPQRDFWTATGALTKKLSGRKDIGGVYLGKEHYFFEKFTDDSYSADRFQAQLDLLAQFAREQEIPVRVLFAPTPGKILPDLLPEHAVLYDMDRVFAAVEAALPQCQVIDLRQALSGQTRQVYYRTDHHWTTYGAYLGYRSYCEAAGLEARSYESFRVQQLTDSFYGTLYSKTLDGSALPDAIEVPQNLPEVTVTEDGVQSASVYDLEKLETKDKYAVFFGGNPGQTVIDTGAGNGKRLLVVKDSFANSLVPFLLEDYEQIIMVDLRYFGGSVKGLIQEYGITDALILYEMSNFLSDANTYKLTY